MSDRKKLVELIANAKRSMWGKNGLSCELARNMYLAERLIAHGVTVLPCNVGDKIYQTDGVRIYESTIGEITLTTKHTIFVTENIAFDERAIGKSIFLSHEEAESHLPQPPKER